MTTIPDEMVPGPPCARCGEPMPSRMVPVADALAPRYHLSCYADAVRDAEPAPPEAPTPPPATRGDGAGGQEAQEAQGGAMTIKMIDGPPCFYCTGAMPPFPAEVIPVADVPRDAPAVVSFQRHHASCYEAAKKKCAYCGGNHDSMNCTSK